MSETVVDTSKNFISGVIEQKVPDIKEKSKYIDTSYYESILKSKINIGYSLSLANNILFLSMIIYKYTHMKDEKSKFKIFIYLFLGLFGLSLMSLNIFTLYNNNKSCYEDCKIKNKDNEITITYILYFNILTYIILLWFLYKCDIDVISLTDKLNNTSE
jgi:hypothetical protein